MKCGECKWFGIDGDGDVGACHKETPKFFINHQGLPTGAWPPTSRTKGWCGEFKEKPASRPARKSSAR